MDDMETVQVKKSDFSRILNAAEVLVDEVEQAMSQDDVVKKRINDIVAGRVRGKSEADYYAYLEKRGIKV